MAMFIIRNNINSVIDLSGYLYPDRRTLDTYLSLSIRKNSSVLVDDKWYNLSSIQSALSLGEITITSFPSGIDGDLLPPLSQTKKGAAPPTGTPSQKFLRDDNVWAAVGDDDHVVTEQVTVGESVVPGNTLYLNSNGKWYKSDANSVSTMPVARISLEAKSANETCEVLVIGRIENASWTWTIGGFIYASGTAGAMTQTAPSVTGDQVQVLGIACAVNKVIFQPSLILSEVL